MSSTARRCPGGSSSSAALEPPPQAAGHQALLRLQATAASQPIAGRRQLGVGKRRLRGPAAAAIDEGPAHDLDHPGAEAGPLFELAEVTEADEQRLLEQVSGAFRILLQPASEAV